MVGILPFMKLPSTKKEAYSLSSFQCFYCKGHCNFKTKLEKSLLDILLFSSGSNLEFVLTIS